MVQMTYAAERRLFAEIKPGRHASTPSASLRKPSVLVYIYRGFPNPLPMITRRQQVLDLVRHKGVLRPKDLAEHGFDSGYLSILVQQGTLQRVGRGLYLLAGHSPSEHHSLAEAARRIPNGIVSLLSALRYHELTTQAPFEVWMAIPEKAWQPRVDHPRIRTVRVSGKALEFGVEKHDVERVSVRIYSPAKTVADCFKFRNRIGLDVALEALRDAWAKRVVTMDDLWRAADATRMKNVMRPYLEMVA